MRGWTLTLVALVCGCDAAVTVTLPDATARTDAPWDVAAPPDANKPEDVWAAPAQCALPFAGEDAGVAVRGHAFNFGPTGGRIRGAFVTALELPDGCAQTDAQGAYELRGFAPGGTATLAMHHPGHSLIQTGTLTVGTTGLERVTFQAPDHSTYRVMELVLRLNTDPARCQIATTVTRVGLSLYDPVDHGEADATVTIEPPIAPPAQGPVYFAWLNANAIVPDRSLRQTTRDGGVLFLNVPPGEYVLTAHKAGVRFTQARIRCSAGFLVNASPPWGLQSLAD